MSHLVIVHSAQTALFGTTLNLIQKLTNRPIKIYNLATLQLHSIPWYGTAARAHSIVDL